MNPIEAGESLGVLLGYEKLIASIVKVLWTVEEKIREDYGIPFPFSLIILAMLTFVTLFSAQKIRMFFCRPKPKATPLYNRIDMEDISLMFKRIKDIHNDIGKAERSIERSSEEIKKSDDPVAVEGIEELRT